MKFVKDQMVVDVWHCLQGLCSVPLVYISVLVPFSFDYCSLVYSFKFSSVMPPTLFFLLRIGLTMQGLFWFHMKFKVVFSSSVKKVIGSLIGIALNL